jgi:hypothetical protein
MLIRFLLLKGEGEFDDMFEALRFWYKPFSGTDRMSNRKEHDGQHYQ